MTDVLMKELREVILDAADFETANATADAIEKLLVRHETLASATQKSLDELSERIAADGSVPVKEVADLREQLADADKATARVAAERDEARSQLEAAHKQLAQLGQERNDAVDEAEAQCEQRCKLLRESGVMTKEIADLREQLAKTIRERDEEALAASSFKQERDETQAAMESVELNISDQAVRIDQLKQERDEARAKLAAATKIEWKRPSEHPIPTEPGVEFVAFWEGEMEVVSTVSYPDDGRDGHYVYSSHQMIGAHKIERWLPIPERNP